MHQCAIKQMSTSHQKKKHTISVLNLLLYASVTISSASNKSKIFTPYKVTVIA